MIAEFAVVHDGTRVAGVTTPLSAVETEDKFDCGVTSLFLGESPRMKALYWLMWRSLHPHASTSDDTDFYRWLAGVESFEVGAELPPPSPGG